MTRLGDVSAGPKQSTVTAELWSAECFVGDDVGSFGVAFTVVAGLMMVVGVVLERIPKLNCQSGCDLGYCLRKCSLDTTV